MLYPLELNDIRLLYSESADNVQKAEQLYTYLQNHAGNHPVLLAYQAAAEALKAKHAFSPLYKWDQIRKAQQIFRKAVEIDPKNIEIRFLRFSIQLNTPSLLGLSGELNQDKKVILENIIHSDLNREMLLAIADYLIKSGQCSREELSKLENIRP